MQRPKRKPQRNTLFARIKSIDPVILTIWAVGASLVVAAIVFYLVGFIKQNLTGEAFYDFQYPYLHPFSESWKIFFFDRIQSRLLHGVLVSTLYSLFGFNPPAYYLAGLLFVIATAVLVALILRPYIRSRWMAAVLVVALTWLPLNIPDLMVLKKLHHAFAWFAFWLAVYLWQKWVKDGRLMFLAAAALSFLASILSYEVAVALFPVAVFVSIPKMSRLSRAMGNLGICIWITLLSGLAFLNLERLKEFSRLETVSAQGGWNFGNILSNSISLLPKLPIAIWDSGLLEMPNGIELWISKLVLALALVLAVIVFWQSARKDPSERTTTMQMPLVLAGLWLIVATYLPFMIAGQAPDSDGMRGAAFGFVFIVLAGRNWLVGRGMRLVGNVMFLSSCLFWTFSGLSAYTKGIAASRQDDIVLENVIITLKELVPDVSEGTNFIFVNSGLGRTGCIGFVNMLYDRSQLHCIHLLSGDTQESYTRTQDGLIEKGGRLWPNHFVIVTFDDQGKVTLLDQLDQNDFENLPIFWQSTIPLETNLGLIFPANTSLARNFNFYKYMKEKYYSH